MLKNAIAYGVSSALNKGASFLLLPILLKFYSIDDIGIYGLVLVTVQLLISISSFGGAAGILRQGVDSSTRSKQFFNFYLLITISFYIVAGIFTYGFQGLLPKWFVLSLPMALVETVLTLGLYILISINYKYLYAVFSFLRILCLMAAGIICGYLQLDLQALVYYQTLALGVLCVVAIGYIYFMIHTPEDHQEKANFSQKLSTLSFTTKLIPHTISQWITSSSDRMLIKWFLGPTELGYYTIAYSLAQLIMPINSSLGLILPYQSLNIKSASKIESVDYRHRIYKFATMLFLGLFVGTATLLWLNSYFNVFELKDEIIFPSYCLIFAGLTLLCAYHTLTNFNFVSQKSGVISLITMSVAVLNVALTCATLPYLGIFGAALSTCLCYYYYLYMTFASVQKRLQTSFLQETGTIFWFSLVIFSIGMISYVCTV